jgi:hypothetical protein
MQNQVAEVAIVGGWEEFGRSTQSLPKSYEYSLCGNVVNHYIKKGTSMLLSFHGRTKDGLCEKAALY